MKNLYIFDLDGTLIDSKQIITKCYKKVMRDLLPENNIQTDDLLIGPSLHETASKLLGNKNYHLIDEFKEKFIEIHDNNLLREIKMYEYAGDLLEQLHIKGNSLMIATNKRIEPTNIIVDQFGWRKYFLDIFSTNKYKKKEDGIREFLKKHSKFEEIFLIGDTLSDGIAANKLNIKFLKAVYGYGSTQDWSQINVYREISSLRDLISKN